MASYGRFTQIDLGDLSFLSRESLASPRLDREAARFALELAAVAYDFDVNRWLDAGWTDISIQADEKLLGGLGSPEYAQRPIYQRLLNEWQPLSARRHIASTRVMRQARDAIWKPEPHQTGKAITMIKALPDGRFAVIIGFMGTGKRRMDWESNFRLGHPEGYHEGFMQLTEQFEQNCPRIQFEQTARLMGLEELSLADIIEDCRREDSRFVLFAAGHSQGAAVLQLWLHRRLNEGLRRDKLLGYGFAPPSVAFDALDCEGYPLFHFVNSDDIVPRVGLYHHIGKAYIYEADEAFRAFCYRGSDSDPLFMHLLERAKSYHGTQDVLMFLIAYLELLGTMAQQEVAEAVSVIAGGGFAERILLRRDEPLEGVLRLMRRMLRSHYQTALGSAYDERLSAALAEELRPEVVKAGAENYTRMMLQVMSVPHTLVFREVRTPGLAPYAYMVLRGFTRMKEMNGHG